MTALSRPTLQPSRWSIRDGGGWRAEGLQRLQGSPLLGRALGGAQGGSGRRRLDVRVSRSIGFHAVDNNLRYLKARYGSSLRLDLSPCIRLGLMRGD